MSRDPRIDPRAGDIVRADDGTEISDFVVLGVEESDGDVLVHWAAHHSELEAGRLHIDGMTLPEWRDGWLDNATVIRVAGGAS